MCEPSDSSEDFSAVWSRSDCAGVHVEYLDLRCRCSETGQGAVWVALNESRPQMNGGWVQIGQVVQPQSASALFAVRAV